MTRIRVSRPGMLILDVDIETLVLKMLTSGTLRFVGFPFTIEVTVLEGESGGMTEVTQVTEVQESQCSKDPNNCEVSFCDFPRCLNDR